MLVIGHGFDTHQLVEGRKLILGGVDIPWPKGLLGHSDGDVLSHAVALALLGALRMGDLGDNFPDTDPAYKDISSLELLRKVRAMIARRNDVIQSIDTTIVAQNPRVSPYKAQMAQNIADALGIECCFVSVKACTTEHLGFIGREEGISAFAVCLVEVIN